MPRSTENQITSAFGKVQNLVRQLVSNLGNEIRSKEAQLRRLKEAETTLSGLAGSPTTDAGGRATSRAVGDRARVNWSIVLEQLPKQFKAGDVRKVREVKNKRHSEILAAITRWVGAGVVKRTDRGVYKRVK